VIRRGELWRASLPEPAGSGPGFRRPLLVVSANSFNESRISTVLAVVVTSNLRLADAPGNVQLAPRATGLPRPSVANVSQLVTVDRACLSARIGRVAPRILAEVDRGLRLILSL